MQLKGKNMGKGKMVLGIVVIVVIVMMMVVVGGGSMAATCTYQCLQLIT
jgi:hypothetical protein